MGSAFALSVAMPGISVAQDSDESELDALEDKPAPLPPKIEPAGAVELRDAIRRIAVRPNDTYALTDAGYASLKLGDADAAFNFFTRASKLQPADPRIKAGLASAMVRRENPFEALRLFDEAARLGASERSFAMDRALAYDLLGNFERAQKDYQNARSYVQSDELTRRQAISLSLLGKAGEADAMLYPLLQRDDAEAWRARAFILASRGDSKEAEKIALSFLSAPEARRLEYYFRQMTRLTPAQQAAALHFGHFPTGGAIGQDSEQVRVAAVASGVKPRAATGDGRLLPAGEPLGGKGAKQKDVKKPRDRKPAAADVSRTVKRGQGDAMATANAQAVVDRAAVAAPRMSTASQLPQPETARPLVRIVLPAAKPQPVPPPVPLPVPVTVATAPVGLPVAVNIPPKTVPVPAAMESKPITATETRPIVIPSSNQPSISPPTQAIPKPAIGELPPVGPAVGPITRPPLEPVATAAASSSVARPNDVRPASIPPAPTPIAAPLLAPAPVVPTPTTPTVPATQTVATTAGSTIGIIPPKAGVVTPSVSVPPATIPSAPSSPAVASSGPSIAILERPPLPAPTPSPVVPTPTPIITPTAAPVVPTPSPVPAAPSIATATGSTIGIIPPKTDATAPMTAAPPAVVPPAPAPPVVAPSGPGFAVLEGPPAPPVAMPVKEAPPINTPVAQGPNIDGTVVSPIATQPQPVIVPSPAPPLPAVEVPVQVPKTETVVSEPATAPAPENKSFDLGSVIDSIAIPEKEQVRDVAPVDLKAIKPAPAKAEEPAKADAAKLGKNAKPAASPARIWVQMATGADVSALTYDYRRWVKKVPALFSGVDGYSAVWGKSRRLLAGPFTDMRAAKKWEAEFRKNGGGGFVWQSENGTAVDPLKGK
jgi:Flp pilus assembly protein TadD